MQQPAPSPALGPHADAATGLQGEHLLNSTGDHSPRLRREPAESDDFVPPPPPPRRSPACYAPVIGPCLLLFQPYSEPLAPSLRLDKRCLCPDHPKHDLPGVPLLPISLGGRGAIYGGVGFAPSSAAAARGVWPRGGALLQPRCRRTRSRRSWWTMATAVSRRGLPPVAAGGRERQPTTAAGGANAARTRALLLMLLLRTRRRTHRSLQALTVLLPPPPRPFRPR